MSLNESPYALIPRLVKTLHLLQRQPTTARKLCETISPETQPAGASGLMRTIRDVRALRQLGFLIQESGKPITFTLIGWPIPPFSNEELNTLALIRETFGAPVPHSGRIQQLLERLTASLPETQRRVYLRRPALRVPLHTAIDYRPYEKLILWLEESISNRHQIAFDYQSVTSQSVVRHDPLDPYEIEYFHNHFYLIAYSYRWGYTQEFRIDRIIENENSPQRLHTLIPGIKSRRLITFTYRLPARFVEHGVSERFIILDHSTKEEPNGEWAYITAQGRSDFWIIRTLLAYAENAVIVEPAWLKEKYLATLRAMLAANESHSL
ncbi:MAG TPA: WYL domain-containing protein [Ktedonobacterales bacterium]|jgi:predicted DNA-binding transcriptional regulator YafY